MEASIEFEKYRGETIYYLCTDSDVPKIKLWLSNELTLTRLKKDRGFVRKLHKAMILLEKILSGEIREGVGIRNGE